MYNTIQKFNNLRDKKDIVVLAIESSCDETACSIVKNGREVLSNIIASQIEIHRRFGGVVPEVASRNHTLAILGCVDEALNKAEMTFDDIDAIAVTYGAGLVGALLVGVSTAKALSYAKNIPLIKVNHIEGHICANYIEYEDLKPPFLSLVASGGHTSIIQVDDYTKFKLIGSTTDDAIGEAFDKVARLLGLPYPGGPEIDRLSKLGQPNIKFYQAPKKVKNDLSLSYSGLKTAVVNYLHNKRQKGEEIIKEDVCASLTKEAVDLLTDTVLEGAKRQKSKIICLAGGVAANSYLRSHLKSRAEEKSIKVLFPKPILCTDNACMIGSRAYFSIRKGEDLANLDLNAVSNLRI